MILIGIDPGSRKCGYGVLHVEKNKILAAGCGIIKLEAKGAIEDRLLYLSEELKSLVTEYKPDISAVEAIFYGKNIQTAFTLGHVRGVVVCSLRSGNIPVYSYSPREIKKAVTGNGNASKSQIEYVIQTMLNLKNPAKDDAADGLACAICLYNKVLRGM